MDCKQTYPWLHFVLAFGIVSGYDLSECSRIKCFNNGTAIIRDGDCACHCPPSYSGMLCEYVRPSELMQSDWPTGPYALVMPSTGCPESEPQGWSHGYINLTTVNHIETWREFQTVNGSVTRQLVSYDDLLVSRLFLNYSLQINFCFKHARALIDGNIDWPVSNMNVFGVKEGCPSGFAEEPLEITFPSIRSWRADGYLPYFNVIDTDNGTKLETKICWLNERRESPNRNKTNSFIVVQKKPDKPCDTAMPVYTMEDTTLAICDASINNTDISDCSKLGFCVYSPVPELDVVFSKWPDFPIALLMPGTGCPKFPDWGVSYIRFTTSSLVNQAYYDHIKTNETDYENVLDGDFNLYFCYKKRHLSVERTVQWPRGEYSVFRMTYDCPNGFMPERVHIILPPIRSWYEYGDLPVFQVHTNNSECKQDEFDCQGRWGERYYEMKICVKKSKVCDGYKDCPNNLDEDELYCSNGTSVRHVVYSVCERELGLTDGTIEDGQLTASSWRDTNLPQMARPLYRGWCPSVNDDNPFLQIDLSATGLIKGLILFNDAVLTRPTEQNVVPNVPEVELLGSRSFHVFYGISKDRLKQYDLKPFEVDITQYIAIPQQFTFLHHFFARFVRVHPVLPIDDGKVCLRLELIGCFVSGESPEDGVLRPGTMNQVNITVSGYQLITSTGYPDQYESSTVFHWHVTTSNTGYLRFTFAVIDLYTKSILPDFKCSEDTVIFNEEFAPITSLHNGLILTFPTSRSRAVITFSTCRRMYRSDERRKGFKLILKREAIPTVWTQLQDMNILQGQLVSYSLLGFATVPTSQTWSLDSSANGGPLNLTILYFNFPPKPGVVLTMKIGDMQYEDYHNNHRPLKEIIEWKIWIGLFCEEAVTSPFPQGFLAVFHIVTIPRYYKPLLAEQSSSESTVRRASDMYKVCSNIFKKCYFLRTMKYQDWYTQHRFCQHHGRNLISIHSRKEQNFLQSWLWYELREFCYSGRAKDFMTENCNKRFYIHLGLIRQEGINGLEEMWTDGVKLSFTGWGKEQPKNTRKYRCTGLKIHKTTGETAWVTNNCQESEHTDPQYYFASVCETPFNLKVSQPALVVNMTENRHTMTRDADILSTLLMKCNSSEFVSQFAVCDGIPDCIDGSDEYSCTSKTFVEGSKCFVCGDGECLPYSKVCNHVSDCLDGSDEQCTFPDCYTDEFSCSNGQCIPRYQKCDVQRDCLDGSDEEQCETCNTTVAFACDDMTCIRRSLLCNNIPDCSNGEDETNCDMTFTTCHDYWKSGYDEHFIFRHPEYGQVECVFQQSSDGVVTITTVFHTRRRLEVMPFLALQFDWRSLTWDKQTCSVQISDTCAVPLAEIDKYNHVISNVTSGHCTDNQYNASFYIVRDGSGDWYFDKFQDTNDEIIWYRWGQAIIVKDKSNEVRDVVVQPIKCKTELSVSLGEIRCGDGTIVSDTNQCLYDVRNDGTTTGCRNFKHLEECEMFSCPHGYAKCPSSFCVSLRLICNGEKNCPDGEDELGCECRGRNETIVTVYDGKLSHIQRSRLFKFARQFYSVETNLFSFSYTRDTFESHNLSYTVAKTNVHPYTDALNIVIKDMVEHQCCLADTLVSLFDNNESIIVFNIVDTQLLKGQLSEAFRNSPVVRHVFNIRIDPQLRQSAILVENSPGETEIRLNSWKTLGSVNSNIFLGLCVEEVAAHCVKQYRCSSSRTCIPLTHICDGEKHCPFGDDESACDFWCPKKCSCSLYVANCRLRNFTGADLQTTASTVRVLDMSQNELFMNHALTFEKAFPFLFRLYASACNLHSITMNTFQHTVNLLHLDLSHNQITVIKSDTFSGLVNLKSIDLSGNNRIMNIDQRAFKMLSRLTSLSITHTQLSEILPNTFTGLTLKSLNISYNKMHTIHGRAFDDLSVGVIDFRGNDITTYHSAIFTGIRHLKQIWSPAFQFCCYKPSFVSDRNCFPSKDEFSSCDDLMRNSILQTLLWVIGAIALVGNTSTLMYRIVYRKKRSSSYGTFVTHLAASDFLMGVYMIILAIADLTFRKRYVEMDDYWRNSIWCTIAGVLATVSSETSVLLMCIITIDRILVIKFPLGQWRFNSRRSRLAVISCWFISWTVAVTPLVAHSYFEGKFYSQSSVCLALPLFRNRRPGWLYSFLIFVGLNFVAFILIAIGQFAIYLEIKQSSRRMKNVRFIRSNDDIGIAKNLLLVLATDFFCWFPIGIMAILAFEGYEIPRDIYAWTAVLILPVNSALNPFLYTFSSLRSRKANHAAGSRLNGTSTDMINLNRRFSRHVLITPRDALHVSLSIVRRLHCIHTQDLVFGEQIIDKTERIYFPIPRKSEDLENGKKNDIRNAGELFETLLNIVK